MSFGSIRSSHLILDPQPTHSPLTHTRSCTLGAQANADGSAYLEQGQTRVLAVVHGPHEVGRRGDALHDRALLECSLHHAPFAGFDRKRRRATDRGSLEMALAVRVVGWPFSAQ